MFKYMKVGFAVGVVLGCLGGAHWITVAHAETYVGVLESHDAGSVNNYNNGYSDGLKAGAAAFQLPNNKKLTFVCDSAGFIGTNLTNVDAGNGMPVIAGEKFPTSVSANNTRAALLDGGTVTSGGAVSVAPDIGVRDIRCKVFTRDGTE